MFNFLHCDIFNVIDFKFARLSIKKEIYDNLSTVTQFFLKLIFMIDRCNSKMRELNLVLKKNFF